MPQISLEYTTDLVLGTPAKTLVLDLHRILSERGGVALEACKTRVRPVETFFAGGGGDTNGFVHLKVEIFAKSDAWKSEIGGLLLESVTAAFPERGAAPVTVHISDHIERSAYLRDPPMASGTATPRERAAQAFDVKARTGSNQAVMDLCAEDVEWTIHGSGALCRTYHGKADFVDNCLAVLGARIDGSITARVDSILTDGDTVIVFWRGKGRTTWGDPYENDYCWVFHFEGEVARRVDAYIDTLLLDRTMSHPHP